MSRIPASRSGIYIPPQRIGFKTLSATESETYCELANRALRLLGVYDGTIDYLVRHSNVTVKVRRRGLPSLALRIRTGPSVSATTELTWLTAVRDGTQIRTVEPFSRILEENTVNVMSSESETTVECSLFLWAAGEPLAAHLTPNNYHILGTMSAELHNFANTWTPPSGLNPLRWDRTMYYQGSRLVVGDSKYSGLISVGEIATVLRVTEECDQELSRLAAMANPIFLHGNIEMWNVLKDEDGLRLLDFEDVMLGQPIQDVANTLYYGMERADYPTLRSAFHAGYTSVRDWPVSDPRSLDLMMAARATMLLNHALQTENEPLPIIHRLLPIITRAG